MRPYTLDLYKRFRASLYPAVDALTAARSLTEAYDRDWSFSWQDDSTPILDLIDPSVEPPDFLDREHIVSICLLLDATNHILAACGGIIDADNDSLYRLSIEAELAGQAATEDPLPYPFRPGDLVKVVQIIDPEASDGLEADSILIGQTGKVAFLDVSEPLPIVVNLHSGQYNFQPEELSYVN